MGITKFFKSKAEKQRIEKEFTERIEFLEKENGSLRQTIAEQSAVLTDDHKKAIEIRRFLSNLSNELNQYNAILSEKRAAITTCDRLIAEKNSTISRLDNDIIRLEEEVLLQEFGLYTPIYNFANLTEYKERLQSCRYQQKQMILSGTAATCNTQWAVDGSLSKGQKMTKDNIKQALLIFNTECENAISKVTFSNFDSMKKRIDRAFEKINKLNVVNQVTLSTDYLQLKHTEISLAYEYERKKQEEKEYIREQRAIEKENAKVQRELEEERQRILKEQSHYQNAMNRLIEQLKDEIVDAEKRQAIQERINNINCELKDLEEALKEVDYRKANERAGYVYIISNIGAFGEGVYKIGMTRRLDPMDRIDELGGASVPFKFDVHALIFSADAPKLETALHNAFSARRVNMMNARKEYFRVPLEEIERVVKENHDRTVDFKYIAIAEQYRETQKLIHQERQIVSDNSN